MTAAQVVLIAAGFVVVAFGSFAAGVRRARTTLASAATMHELVRRIVASTEPGRTGAVLTIGRDADGKAEIAMLPRGQWWRAVGEMSRDE